MIYVQERRYNTLLMVHIIDELKCEIDIGEQGIEV